MQLLLLVMMIARFVLYQFQVECSERALEWMEGGHSVCAPKQLNREKNCLVCEMDGRE